MTDDTGGMLQTIFGSIRTHFEDRLKSPFAGAFLVAWLAVNWKPVLILAFSTISIEERISKVSTEYFSSWSVLWWPLIYAAVGVVGYYIVATIFAVLYEAYGVLRRLVERWFDSYRWVDPSTYIATKSSTRKQIQELTALASDQIERISLLADDAAKAEAEKTTAEAVAADAEARAKAALSMMSVAKDQEKNLVKALQAETQKAGDLEKALRALKQATEILVQQAKRHLPIEKNETGIAALIRPLPAEAKVEAIADAEQALKNVARLLSS